MKILKFGATWCAACNSLDKILEKEGIVHEKIDIDKDMDAATKYGIRSIPQLFIVNDDGTVVSQISGGRPTPTQIAELKKI